jgi:hypothetical protein
MRKPIFVAAGILLVSAATADNLDGVDEMICSAAQAQICYESGECYSVNPWELSIPDFVVIDTKKKTVSTTKASQLNRSTAFSKVEKIDGLIYLQGIEGGRAFSFVVDEATGRMTVSVARDGLSVTVFGACTDTDI